MLWDDFEQKVPARAEVCIKDDKIISISPCERPSEIAGFFESRTIIAYNIIEPESLSKVPHGLFVAIIKDPDLNGTRVHQLLHILPGVLEDFQRLRTDWQEDIDRWGGFF